LTLEASIAVMGLLKGVPAILSPELFNAIHSMGHGDEIVLADANFPAR
jgi:L-fucose mutarotase